MATRQPEASPDESNGAPALSPQPDPRTADGLIPSRQPVATAYDVVLRPTERVATRDFTDPDETRRDLLVMTDMLARERAIARTWPPGLTGPGISEQAGELSRQMLAVPDGGALQAAVDVTAVGFFGQLRAGVDHGVLFTHERAIAQTFPSFAELGFLSYFDIGPEHGKYGNLILFWTPDVPAEWHLNPAHRSAVAIAQQHYDFVRLHKGRIAGPFLGDGELHIERTQYLDFRGAHTWRGLRLYDAAE
jgi:hypothetical protein